MIYFIQGVSGGPIKIGHTKKSLDVRLKSLQTGYHEELVVLKLHKGSVKTEAELHALFAEYRLGGEWFQPCDLIDFYLSQVKTIDIETQREIKWSPKKGLDATLASIEKGLVLGALKKCKWNRIAAAKELCISYRSIRHRIQKHNLL